MNRSQLLTRRASTLAIPLLWGVIATAQDISITVDPVNVRQQGTCAAEGFGGIPHMLQSYRDPDTLQSRPATPFGQAKPAWLVIPLERNIRWTLLNAF